MTSGRHTAAGEVLVARQASPAPHAPALARRTATFSFACDNQITPHKEIPMGFRSLSDALKHGRTRTRTRHTRPRDARRCPAAVEIRLETLEDRCLLSVSPITTLPVGTNPQAVTTSDVDNDGRLQIDPGSWDPHSILVRFRPDRAPRGAARLRGVSLRPAIYCPGWAT